MRGLNTQAANIVKFADDIKSPANARFSKEFCRRYRLFWMVYLISALLICMSMMGLAYADTNNFHAYNHEPHDSSAVLSLMCENSGCSESVELKYVTL